MLVALSVACPRRRAPCPPPVRATLANTEDAIRATVIRLCRPDGYGSAVIDRAAIVAEGAPAGAIEEWILAHGGEPRAPIVAVRSGLYGLRPDAAPLTRARAPRRYVLPAEALS